jgi:hypothetical protein
MWARALIFVVAMGACSADVAEPTTAQQPASTTSVATSTTTAPTTTATSTTTSTTSTTTTTTTSTTSLPDPSSLPRSGTGEFVFATAGEFEVDGSPMIEFSIAVEEGSGVDIDELRSLVVATLGSQRSWVGRGTGFHLVDEGGLFTLAVATPDTVDELCLPLQTGGRLSCARNGWIALNLLRWETATEDWPADLITYRRYLVNHEVGHYILGPNHESCPGEGEAAPIMMQQTKGLDGCLANGWVDP